MSLETYAAKAFALLQEVLERETPALKEAARVMADAITADRLIYAFGTGHSYGLAAELFHRAGGLAPVSLMMDSGTAFEPGATASTFLERVPGYGVHVVERYPVEAGDVLLAISNSAANAVVLDVARAAKARGMTVIALLSRPYAQMKNSPMPQIAHLVLDNHTPPGDALVEVGGETVAAGSGVVGSFILSALVAEVAGLLAAGGRGVPAYRSSNMPGAEEHNAGLLERYRHRVKHL